MDGVLSPIGIFTPFLVNIHFYTTNIYDSCEFCNRVLYDNDGMCHLNHYKLDENGVCDAINSNFMVFKNENVLDTFYNSFILFPMIGNTMTAHITDMQLKFLQNNIDILSVYQEFVINDFLLTAGLTPISEIFVSDDCLKCMRENDIDYLEENNYFENFIINKCKYCNVQKYNKKIKLIHDFTNDKNDISNEDKIIQYNKNGLNIINGRFLRFKTEIFYKDKINVMFKRYELLNNS